ncbi:MAG TPA: hypothetical protein VK662_09220, partial [Acidothermaceae bacterium]|nr:hypothetical protein [Acidothermaceae bacterium]
MRETDPLTTRAALAAGMTADQLRSKRWVAPFRGVHLDRVATPDPDVHSISQALIAVTSGSACISDRTAAEVYEWWLPTVEGTCTEITVAPESVVNRPGVRCHRRVLSAHDVSEWKGLPITTPVRTIVDLAGQLCLIDLVVLIDSAVRLGHCSIDELRDSTQQAGRRGVRNLRKALPLVT